VQTYEGVASGSFVAPDHEYPSFLELSLTAEDSAGLRTTTSVRLQPRPVTLAVRSSPTGAPVSVFQTTAPTPLDYVAIARSHVSMTAPATFATGGFAYSFTGWSDGGARSHIVVAPEGGGTYTASYRQLPNSTPPTAAMTLPDEGATIAGTRLVGAFADDDVGVKAVQFLRGSTVIGNGTLTAYGWVFSWDTRTVPDGTYDIVARATDYSGNTGTSPPRTVHVANNGG
jgi:hypothetical protein